MSAQLASRDDQPISVGGWLITLIVLAIPLVNIIMLFVWGFSAGTPVSKQNFCRAYLILLAIVIVLWIIFAVLFGAALGGLASHSGGNF